MIEDSFTEHWDKKIYGKKPELQTSMKSSFLSHSTDKNDSRDGPVINNLRVTETLACLLGRRRMLPLALLASSSVLTIIPRALLRDEQRWLEQLGNLACALATQGHRGQLLLTVVCYRSGTLLMSRHRARRLNLFHQRKPKARPLHLATHTLRRLTSTCQNMWIHQHQNRYPVKNVQAILRRHGLSAQIPRAAVTQVPRLHSQTRSGTKKSYSTKLARYGSCSKLLDRTTLDTKKAADWDSGMVRYKRSDGSIHRLFELDRESGMLKVGEGAVSSGLNLRLAEMLSETNFGEYEVPFSSEKMHHPGFRSCNFQVEHTRHCKEIKNWLLGYVRVFLYG